MERKKHKHKRNHVVIVTSDAVDANVKQFRISPLLFQVLVIVACVIIGAVLGYFFNEEQIREITNRKVDEQKEIVARLEEEKAVLEEEKAGLEEQIVALNIEIESLNNKIDILSETVNQKTEIENELTAKFEQQYMPTEYPLTGSASMEESTQGDPICVFTAATGVTVVATASGTVTAINEDAEYGNNVWVDHGNGYITIYRNQGNVNVKLGDSVSQGTTLFIIGKDNTRFGYQIMKDGTYIDPMEMLSISG